VGFEEAAFVEGVLGAAGGLVSVHADGGSADGEGEGEEGRRRETEGEGGGRTR